MKEKKLGKQFKKFLSVLLVFALTITTSGNWNLLTVNAEDGPEIPSMIFSFDDRGNPDNSYVTLDGTGITDSLKVNPWDPVEVTPGGTYGVNLTPPEERQGFEPIVEVRIHIEEDFDTVYSNVGFYDEKTDSEEEPNLTLTDGRFEFTLPSEKFAGADVNIWWCDYDRVGPNDMEYCVEVVRNGDGEAFIDGFDEYFSVWEFEEFNEQNEPIRNWGGQKMIIPKSAFEEGAAGENGFDLKFAAFNGFSFGRLEVNKDNEEPFVLDAADLPEGEEPVYHLTKDDFDDYSYLNMNLSFDNCAPQLNFFYDEYMGEAYISGPGYESPARLGCGQIDNFAFGETYSFSLVPPENKNDYIVEIRVHNPEEPDTVYSNVSFYDEALDKDAEPNLEIVDNSFNFTVPMEENFCGVDINIWWSDFDRIGSNDQEYCIEVIRNGDGEAFIEALSDCPRIWEFEEFDDNEQPIRNWGREKIIIPRIAFETGEIGENGLDIKFSAYEGFSFGRLQVNKDNEEPFVLDAADLPEGEEPVYHLTKEDFNFDGYLNMEVNFDGGAPALNVFYDDYVGEVNISGPGYENPVKLGSGPVDSFTFGETYTFGLVPPENRTKDCECIVEIRVRNQEGPDTFYSNIGFYDEEKNENVEPNLPIENGSFTFTVPAEDEFFGVDINIWWSEFDRIGGNDEEYCIQVMNDRNGDSFFAGKEYFMIWEFNGIDSETGDAFGYGNQKFMIPKSDVANAEAELKFNAYEGYSFYALKVYDASPSGTLYSADELGENPVFVLTEDLFDEWGNLMVETRYSSNGQPGPGGSNESAKRFAEFVSDGIYMYGDWNDDGEVDEEDLVLGIAQQIYYPQFSDPNSRLRDLKSAYPEITSYEDLAELITVEGRDYDSDIEAWSGFSELQGTVFSIPAYKYTFKFADPENSERDVLVESVAWLFDFEGDSEYATNTLKDVVMQITDSTGKTTYFLRNCDTDNVNPFGISDGEGSYSVVGDYEVCYDEEEKKYSRNVAIMGNGAALDDFIMTDEDETEFVTFQGRNEMFVADAKGNTREIMDKYCIFGKFSFYKPTFIGMKIQGAGAKGNTPAWSFATDPVWSSDADKNTAKEAIVYFGNNTVSFKPVTINGSVTSIANLKKADSTIPDEAVRVYKNEANVWTAEFNSNYYDMVKFEVTYATEGEPVTHYINIHRVGIDIEKTSGGRAGENRQLMHGTENGPVYKLSKDSDTIIKATYYYPEENGTDKLVDLYVTYTWQDGSVTREVISNNSQLNLSFHHDDTEDVQSSDFILYEGSKDAEPVKVEVSAVVAGFDDDTSFTGMKLGSGKGVCWNNFVTKR